MLGGLRKEKPGLQPAGGPVGTTLFEEATLRWRRPGARAGQGPRRPPPPQPRTPPCPDADAVSAGQSWASPTPTWASVDSRSSPDRILLISQLYPFSLS